MVILKLFLNADYVTDGMVTDGMVILKLFLNADYVTDGMVILKLFLNADVHPIFLALFSFRYLKFSRVKNRL